MDQVQNFIKNTVVGVYDDTAVTITVSDAELFPDPTAGEYNVVWYDATNYPDPADDPNKEIVRVTARDTGTDEITVTRNQESSGASTKNTAGATYKMILGITKKTFDEKINRDETDASGFGFFKDENDMASDSDEAVASQQSIKAYVDNIFSTKYGVKYKIYNPYSGRGANEYQGQMHCHSDESDGADSPTDLVTAYKTAGYDFVALTDHDTITADPSVADITFIPSAEIGTQYHPHIPAYDITNIPTTLDISEIVKYYNDLDQACGFAHPNALTGDYYVPEDMVRTVRRHNFIEVYNSKVGDAYAEDKWDIALTEGKRVFATAVDDCHDVSESAEFDKGWVVVWASSSSVANIMAALKAGQFYASTGNDVDIALSGNTITASSDGSSNFEFIGRNGEVLATENGVTSSEYTITGLEGYVRVKSTLVADSTEAWSQPIFIQLLEDDIEGTKNEQRRLNTSNILINSNFDVWQRGTSFDESSYGYTADRWLFSGNTDQADCSRQSVADENGQYALRLQMTSTSGSQSCNITQGLESQDCYKLRNKTVTFSCLMRRNSSFNAGSVALLIYSGTGTDQATCSTGRVTISKGVAYSDLDTSKWERVFIRTTIGSDRTGVMVGIKLNNNDSVPDGSYVEIRQTQLTIGDEILPYSQKSVNEELRDCWRYCVVLKSTDDAYETFGVGIAYSTTEARTSYFLPTIMRRDPTLTFSAANTFNIQGGGWGNVVPSAVADSRASRGVCRVASTVTGLTAGYCANLTANNTNSAYIIVDAELS